MSSVPRWLAICAAAMGVVPLSTAHASLGGDLRTVTTDADALHGTVRDVSVKGVAVREISTSGGLLVREFLTPAGSVFAIVWRGPVLPDLQRLLGSHFGDYSHAQRASAHSGRARVVHALTEDLVLDAGGHLRAYAGRAYLPGAMPHGFDAADLN